MIRRLGGESLTEDAGLPENDADAAGVRTSYSGDVDPTDVRNPVYTFLRAVAQCGYRRNGDSYNRRSLPPVW